MGFLFFEALKKKRAGNLKKEEFRKAKKFRKIYGVSYR